MPRDLASSLRFLSRLSVIACAMMLTGVFVSSDTATASPTLAPALSSSTPKTVILDPATGAVVSITATRATPAAADATPMISNDNICNIGDGCYYSGRIPYAHQGFSGSPGTFHGSWPYRSGWGTGNYTASACWVGACS